MPDWEVDKLALFLIFFIPGFISMKIYDLLIPGEKRDFSSAVFEAVAFSALNFAALSWLIILIHSSDFYKNHQVWYFVILFCILFLFPIIWAILIARLLKWRKLTKYIINPTPKPWDAVFGRRESYWVIIHLKDGRKIGGKYDTNSCASSYPVEEQIYLEQVWQLDEKGRFTNPLDRSEGIIVLNKDISSIEFFK